MSLPSHLSPSSRPPGAADDGSPRWAARRRIGAALVAGLLLTVAACSSAASPAPSGVLPVTLKSLDKTVAAGKTANISVSTEPGANCTIAVTYSTGPASDPGLQPAVAASNGLVAWGWTVAAGTAAGTYPIDVTCEKGLLKGELKEQFTVK